MALPAYTAPLHENVQRHILNALLQDDHPTEPSAETLETAASAVVSSLPTSGIGVEALAQHLIADIVPGLSGSALSSHYYGFVTGGITPAAYVAENLVSAYDQNVQIHLPQQSIATIVEDKALIMLLDMLHLDSSAWGARTFTTGATASNILGIACGREQIILNALRKGRASGDVTIARVGLISACERAEVRHIQVIATVPHSSLLKAASLTGLGRDSVIDAGRDGEEPWLFDFEKLETALKTPGTASIVSISCGEVNSGAFATTSLEDVQKIRRLCDQYGAWLHVDGAFGILARILDVDTEFETVRRGCEGLDLADSIACDAHKLLNVPYDCGIFFCKARDTVESVCLNKAPYLAAERDPSAIPSPLNLGIENSRRFRALPVYANLVAYGRDGHQHMLKQHIRLARAIAGFIFDHPDYVLLNGAEEAKEKKLDKIYMAVLFRAKNRDFNQVLVNQVCSRRKVFVLQTSWRGELAVRLQVASWKVDMVRDLQAVVETLEQVADEWRWQQADAR